MPSAAAHYYSRSVTSVRSIFRSSEVAIIVLAVGIGLAAGLLTIALHQIAHGMQRFIYNLDTDSLSASSVIDSWRLIALPIGGLILGLFSRAVLRVWRSPGDVGEANALHGGVVGWRDSLFVCAQTIGPKMKCDLIATDWLTL